MRPLVYIYIIAYEKRERSVRYGNTVVRVCGVLRDAQTNGDIQSRLTKD